MANEEVEKEKRELQMQRMKRHAGGRFVGSDEKANDFKGTLKRLLELLRPQLPLLILTLSCLKYYLQGMLQGAVKG